MNSQAVYGPSGATPVRHVSMVHGWDDLTFIHWRFPTEVVQRLLPPGLEVETFDGSAWVGLVPFFIRVGRLRIRPVPWLSRFPETNVRTYARGPDGTTGIWFFSLDAARLGAVVLARATYRLPYFWSAMQLARSRRTLTYECRRRWPGPRGATSSAIVEIGEPYRTDELNELDHFLTARWTLFSAPRSGLHYGRAFHKPWPLHRARLLHLKDELVQASGLPEPSGEPLVHFSPSLVVRIGWPHAVRR